MYKYINLSKDIPEKQIEVVFSSTAPQESVEGARGGMSIYAAMAMVMQKAHEDPRPKNLI